MQYKSDGPQMHPGLSYASLDAWTHATRPAMQTPSAMQEKHGDQPKQKLSEPDHLKLGHQQTGRKGH